MEVLGSSETSVNFYQTMRFFIVNAMRISNLTCYYLSKYGPSVNLTFLPMFNFTSMTEMIVITVIYVCLPFGLFSTFQSKQSTIFDIMSTWKSIPCYSSQISVAQLLHGNTAVNHTNRYKKVCFTLFLHHQ